MKLMAKQNITWTKTDCYKRIKMMTLDDLREFVEVNDNVGEAC